MKSFLYCVGDVHLNSNNPWAEEVGMKFVEWFERWSESKEVLENDGRELVLLGDLTEKDLMTGNVVAMLHRLLVAASLKFDRTYVLVGNHDLRYYKGKLNYSAEFARQLPRVEIIREERLMETANGFPLMCLPFRKLDDGRSIDDYYTNGLPEHFYEVTGRVAVGHVAVVEENKKYGGIDRSRFANEKWVLGHVHTRSGKFAGSYSGSVLPNKIDEEKSTLPRAIRKFELVDGEPVEKDEVAIPKFVTYKDVAYPNEIADDPSEADLTKVYTVSNCRSMSIAKEKYPGKFIRAVHYAKKRGDEEGVTIGGATIKKMTMTEALGAMIKERKLPVKRSVMAYLTSIFSDPKS